MAGRQYGKGGYERPPASRCFKRPMNVTNQKFEENWDNIFGKKEHTNSNTGTPVRALDDDEL